MMRQRGRIKWQLLLTLMALLVSPLASAHLLQVFAWSEGNAIVGNAYFSGGIPAKGARIRVQDKDGNDIATGHPNEKGDFRVEVKTGVPARVVADTNDGHIAHWEIAAATETTSDGDAAADSSAKTAVDTSSGSAAIDRAELKSLVSQAVAEQIGPLRMELQKDAGRFRLADILGGIGYIFGLTGICLWLQTRKRKTA